MTSVCQDEVKELAAEYCRQVQNGACMKANPEGEQAGHFRPEFIPTRESLLSRLRDTSEDGSWREFFETYWKLIYHTARKRGLSSVEAEDVVQDTMVELARRLPAFKYDRTRGSFKTWLMRLTHWKIVDQQRKRLKERLLTSEMEETTPPEFEAGWENDWRMTVAEEAIRRVQVNASPRQYQAYSVAILQGKGAREAGRLLQMSVPAVYMATFKINALIKREVKNLNNGRF